MVHTVIVIAMLLLLHAARLTCSQLVVRNVWFCDIDGAVYGESPSSPFLHFLSLLVSSTSDMSSKTLLYCVFVMMVVMTTTSALRAPMFDNVEYVSGT